MSVREYESSKKVPMSKHESTSSEPAEPFTGSQAGQTRHDNGLNMTLIWIPPGDFIMGSPESEMYRSDDEKQVLVSLTKGFWLGRHSVTQAEWQRVMQTTPWRIETYQACVNEGDDYPATYVSWDDAMQFCEKLTETEHQAGCLPSDWQYTLPTEAQWEYACRAGTKTRFSFGDDDVDLSNYGGWSGIVTGNVQSEEYTRRMGQKKANPWGLYDMHGNVCEWCRDVYAEKLAGGTDPQGPSTGQYRVHRGGGRFVTAWGCRSASRSARDSRNRDDDLGFRIAAVPSGT
jgi:formylglycine-generating enzyme required for sulfatase activity